VRTLARLRRARLAAACIGGCVVLSLAAPASAETSGQADQKVKQVLTRIQTIQRQVAAAEKAYDEALAGVADSVNTEILDGQARDQIAAAAAAQQAQVDGRVRALYESGGPVALYATLIDADDPNALAEQAIVVQHLVSAGQTVVSQVSRVSVQADAATAAASKRAQARIATERTVGEAAVRVLSLLDQEQRLLGQARSHAAAVRAAELALQAQSSAFSVITSDRIASMRMMPAAPAYMALYRKGAAAMCPGLSWTVLAAIGQVESGHGRDTSTSYAGAMGPMQFLPATFAAYAVDGDHDGVASIMDPADAIYSAARYLCANDASTGPNALANAIFHYNHAGWYVQMVLALARQYAAA
jgi:membrane-bound lytic murein transglycosylase B